MQIDLEQKGLNDVIIVIVTPGLEFTSELNTGRPDILLLQEENPGAVWNSLDGEVENMYIYNRWW